MVNIGIIGLGYWGPNLLRNFSTLNECTVLYGCDLSQERLEKLAPQFSSTEFTDDLSQLLNDPKLDAVAIATPVFTHYNLAKQALEHGKHVLLEKPMASTVAECNELISIAEKNNLVLAVDHTFLFTGAIQKIKNIIASGEIGQVYYIDSERINLGLLQPDINVIWDLAPHDISIINYLFGDTKPKSVFAMGHSHVNGKHEEIAHITITYESGVVGHIHVSWLSPVKIRKTLIGGDKKMIMFDDISPTEKIKVYDKGVDVNLEDETPFRPIYRSGDVHIPTIDSTEALEAEAAHFIDCIEEKQKPLADGKAGLEVVKILEATDQSLREGRIIDL